MRAKSAELKSCYFTGTLEGLRDSVIEASKEALKHINILEHKGGHPRKGSIDLIPIHPITEETKLNDCGDIATEIGIALKSTHPELAIFYFGHADLPKKRDLVQRRKQVKWFQEKNIERSKHGLAGIGAIPYMSNFNVMINCNDPQVAKNIATSIRDRNGGLLGVQAMAFPHGANKMEIACNVDLVHLDRKNSKQIEAVKDGKFVKNMGDFYMTPFDVIHNEIRLKAEAAGCSIHGDSVIIGFTPQEAGKITHDCLMSGETYAVGKFKKAQM